MRDLNQLAVFAAVVRHGGFTAAARALALQKSTVSRMVARLEERLETPLLQRTSRHFAVTDAGRLLLSRCEEGLRLLEAAEGVVQTVEQAGGRVRLTAMPDFAERFLAPLLVEFSRREPRIQVELLLTTRVVDLLEERVDVAIRSGPLADSSLMARRVGLAQRYLVASPSYLAARGRPRTANDLKRHECLAYRTSEGTATWRLLTAGRTRNVRLSPRMAADSFTVLHDWAVAGLGITLLPGFVCQTSIDLGRLVPVLRSAVAEDVPVFLVYARDRNLPRRVRVLIDFLVARLSPAASSA